MDFWVWLIVVAIAWLLEALASASKKKKGGPSLPPAAPRRRVEQPRSRQPAPPMRRAPPPAPRAVRVPPPPPPLPPPSPPPAEAEEERVVFEVPVARAPRPRGPEIEQPLEGVSAEEDHVEPVAESTDAQHLRATAKYGPSTAAVVTAGPAARNRLLLGRGTIRDAILWTEILGRPKGGW